VPTLVNAALSGGRIALSSGGQRRDFTYVEDVAEGLLRLGASDAAPGTVVNLATGHVRSVREFVAEAARVLGLSERQLAFGASAPRPDEIRHDAVSVERLVQVTGWRPSTSVTEGLRRTLEHVRRAEPAKSLVAD
jgi:UDP-glucuronate decarboxylase